MLDLLIAWNATEPNIDTTISILWKEYFSIEMKLCFQILS